MGDLVEEEPRSPPPVFNQRIELIDGNGVDLPANNISFVTTEGVRIPISKNNVPGQYWLAFPGDRPVAGQLTISRPGSTNGVNISIIDVPAPSAQEWAAVDLPTGRVVMKNATGGFRVPSAQRTGQVESDGFLRMPLTQPLPLTGNSPSVEVSGGIGNRSVELPQTGTGTKISGGGEHALARLGRRLTLRGYEVEVAVGPPVLRGIGGIDRASLLFSQYSGDDHSSGSVAAGADPVAITYQDFGGMGVTGVFLGASGLDGQIRKSVESQTGGVELRWEKNRVSSWPLTFYGEDSGVSIQPSVFVNYNRVETEIRHDLSTPSFDSIHQSTRTSLDEERFDLGGGVYINRQIDMNASGEIGLHAFVRQSDTDFSSTQTNTCGVCGADNNFTSILHESDDNIDLGVRGSADFRYAFNDNISATLGGQITYVNSVSGIFNPTSGDDLFLRNDTAGIARESSVEYVIKLSVSVAIGDY